MSATLVPCTLYLGIYGPSRAPDAAQRASGALLIRGPLWPRWVPALRSSAKSAAPRAGHVIFNSALDIGRPGLLDQLDHGVRHRDVVEVLGHLAALLEG